jgi:hypothetical protein
VTLNNQALVAEKLGHYDESLALLELAISQQRLATQATVDPRWEQRRKEHEVNKDRVLRKRDNASRADKPNAGLENSP